MRPSALVAVAVVIAGCAAPGAELETSGKPLAPRCADASEPVADGVCVVLFDAEGGWDGEPDLAAHPTDPAKALLTWTRKGAEWQVWVAATTDGGATWTQRPLEPHGAPPMRNIGYDSTVAYARDGTVYVLFGIAECVEAAGCLSSPRMTLARSEDDGATWSYHDIGSTAAGWPGYDYMDVAVSPDSGAVHVATSYFQTPPLVLPPCGPALHRPRAPTEAPDWIVAFTSEDRGASWGCPRILDPAPAPPYVFPRVAAGPGGIVVVGAHREPYSDGGVGAAVSTDGGATFGEFVFIDEFSAGNVDPAVWIGANGGPVIDLMAAGPGGIRVYRSLDLGRTWEGREVAAFPPSTPDGAWAVARGGADGTLAILDKYGREEEPVRLMVRVTLVEPDGSATSTILVDSAAAHGAWVRGDDYGGVAVGADGKIWAAWSDPRVGGHDEARIALATLMREDIAELR